MEPRKHDAHTGGPSAGRKDVEDHEAHLEEERTWSDAGVKIAACNLSEKVINAKESQLRSCIAANYSRIREVEQELHDLQTQLKMTTGPKKSALEMLRKKIETQNEKVAGKRVKVQQIKKVLETAESELKVEEEAKEQLCQELNLIVQQSASAQLSRLEQLTQRLEQLGAGMGGGSEQKRMTAVAIDVTPPQRTGEGGNAPAPTSSAASEKQPSADVGSPFTAADSWGNGKGGEAAVKSASRRKTTAKGKKVTGKVKVGDGAREGEGGKADEPREGATDVGAVGRNREGKTAVVRQPAAARPPSRLNPSQQAEEPFSGFD